MKSCKKCKSLFPCRLQKKSLKVSSQDGQICKRCRRKIFLIAKVSANDTKIKKQMPHKNLQQIVSSKMFLIQDAMNVQISRDVDMHLGTLLWTEQNRQDCKNFFGNIIQTLPQISCQSTKIINSLTTQEVAKNLNLSENTNNFFTGKNEVNSSGVVPQAGTVTSNIRNICNQNQFQNLVFENYDLSQFWMGEKTSNGFQFAKNSLKSALDSAEKRQKTEKISNFGSRKVKNDCEKLVDLIQRCGRDGTDDIIMQVINFINNDLQFLWANDSLTFQEIKEVQDHLKNAEQLYYKIYADKKTKYFDVFKKLQERVKNAIDFYQKQIDKNICKNQNFQNVKKVCQNGLNGISSSPKILLPPFQNYFTNINYTNNYNNNQLLYNMIPNNISHIYGFQNGRNNNQNNVSRQYNFHGFQNGFINRQFLNNNFFNNNNNNINVNTNKRKFDPEIIDLTGDDDDGDGDVQGLQNNNNNNQVQNNNNNQVQNNNNNQVQHNQVVEKEVQTSKLIFDPLNSGK